jgi:hypothetical protein
MNTLISIGWLGGQTCYLNLSLEEAKSRYLKDNPDTDLEDDFVTIKEFRFRDEFSAYDVWAPDDVKGANSDGTDDSGNEYELANDDERDESVPEIDKDPVLSQIETKAKNLAYAITNPETLSRKLREELVSIVGPEAAVTYHLSASFDSSSQEVKFQVARLSPSTVFRLKSDLHTTEVGFAYIKTINGWRVAVGLTASANTGDDVVTRVRAPQGSGDGVDVAGSFSVTVSR